MSRSLSANRNQLRVNMSNSTYTIAANDNPRAPKPGPTALRTALTVAVILFSLLLFENRATLTMDFVPSGDVAADILLTQRAAHGWLLTGHYSFVGVNHPGPFFLYVRLLGQWLSGGLTGSVFGAQLVGVLACSAAFSGLFVALIHRLAEREDACNRTAASAAVAALILALVIIHDDIANIWMPNVLILPFLTFLAAVILMFQGSLFGLLAGTFCAAALVHGYIPMPIVVGPVWLVATILGGRARRISTGHGFPRTAWVGVTLIIALFMLPLALDVIVNPPGNIIRILETAKQTRLATQPPTAYELCKLLGNSWLAGIRHGLWLAIAAGLAISHITTRYRRLVRDGVIVVALTFITSMLAFAQAPTPLREYSARFFIATALLPITLGAVLTILELGRRHRLIAPLSTLLLLLTFLGTGTLSTNYSNAIDIRRLARAIAEENPPGSRIELDSQTKNSSKWQGMVKKEGSIISSLILELDHFGITACYRDPVLGYFVTPERICPKPSSTVNRAYWLDSIPMCRLDTTVPPPERVGRGIIVRRPSTLLCTYIVPLSH